MGKFCTLLNVSFPVQCTHTFQVSLQSGPHYVHPLNGPHKTGFIEPNLQPKLSTLQPSLTNKPTSAAGQVHTQAGLPGVWANHHQEPKLPLDPCPAADVGPFLPRSVMSSLFLMGIWHLNYRPKACKCETILSGGGAWTALEAQVCQLQWKGRIVWWMWWGNGSALGHIALN